MNKKDTARQRALIFPAMTEKISDRRVFFLISSYQVDEIIDNIPVSKVPFSTEKTEGIVKWRDRIMPVIKLERYLGLTSEGNGKRMLVVRTQDNHQTHAEGLRGIIRVGTGIRNVSMPIPCSPIKPDDWFPKPTMIRGAFDWEEALLVVADIKKILNGETKGQTTFSDLNDRNP